MLFLGGKIVLSRSINCKRYVYDDFRINVGI